MVGKGLKGHSDQQIDLRVTPTGSFTIPLCKLYTVRFMMCTVSAYTAPVIA